MASRRVIRTVVSPLKSLTHSPTLAEDGRLWRGEIDPARANAPVAYFPTTLSGRSSPNTRW